jgi:hypothetical protein
LEVEEAFTQVFPHTLGRVKGACGDPSRLVWLMEEKALRAVLAAFGLEDNQLDYYVHGMSRSVTFPKRVDGKKYMGP